MLFVDFNFFEMHKQYVQNIIQPSAYDYFDLWILELMTEAKN